MLEYLEKSLELSGQEVLIVVSVVFIAGIVRGFSGFALSALVMAGLALIIPPISLIPICFLLEMAAGILMIKNGVQNANKKVAWGLAIGAAIGTPVGLFVTSQVPPDISRLLALGVILTLAVLQLFKQSPDFLATRPGLYISGLVAGVANGIGSVGAMVVALYVLSQKAPAPQMRATLVMYLFISMLASGVWLALSGILDSLALTRGLVLAPMAIAGVLLGSLLFRPSLEAFYKRFCMVLLIALAVVGLLRLLPSLL
jgi:uncharacterized membrane protein YfcA